MQPKCMLLSERNQFEKPTYYTIPTIRQPGKQKYRDNKRLVVARENTKERRGIIGIAQVIFRAVKLICVILVVDAWHYAFGKTRPAQHKKMNPNVNYGQT